MIYIEGYVPVVRYNGLNTALPVDFTGAATVALPAATTIGGSAVVALGDITSNSTSASAFTVTNTGVFTGVEVVGFTADSMTSGVLTLMSSTGTLITTGSLLTLTANSATTAAGLLRVNGNALTDGIAVAIASSATALTSTGRLLKVTHSGATTTSGIIAEVTSAATDETVVAKITASGVLALGKALVVSGAAVTTGSLLDISDNTAATSGTMVNLVQNSADTTARSVVFIKQDHASASGATPLEISNDNATKALIKGTATVQSTHFYRFATINSVTIWVGDGTTANGALSGTAGDMLINGGSNKPEYCTGTTSWTALV